MNSRPSRSYLVIASAIVIAGVLISSSLFLAVGEASKTATVTTTVVSTSTLTTTVTTSFTGSITNAPTMTVNGSLYYADDVSSDISVGNPGYSYFHNASVTFLGVKFETYCPPSFSGCPVPPGTTITAATTMFLGAIRLNATFPDKSTETIGAVIGDDDYVFVFSHHSNPQAGVLIVYSTNGYTGGYKAYLLVS